jgi:cysteine desulfurase
MRIYCDHNATTPVAPDIVAAMATFLTGEFANPSSVHAAGSRARCAVEDARRDVAALLGCRPAEVVFTSGGTEANDIALRGALRCVRPTPRRVITTAIEHSSVLATLADLDDVRIDHVAIDGEGRVQVDDLRHLLQQPAHLVSIGWANNEIGTVQPIAAVAELCRRHAVPLHVDAVQAVGKIPCDVTGIDLVSVSAHKIGAPKGVGALVVRDQAPWRPMMSGGGQERGRRGGTENVPGIVAFGCAARQRRERMADETARLTRLRDALWQRLQEIDGVLRHGSRGPDALPNTLNVRFAGVRGEALVASLDIVGIAVSSGSACAAGAAEPSHVLLALGLDTDEARDGVRFSFGAASRDEDVDAIAEATVAAVSRMRAVRHVA